MQEGCSDSRDSGKCKKLMLSKIVLGFADTEMTITPTEAAVD